MTKVAKIAITTNKMPDNVYNHLRAKSAKGDLTQYVISLVQRDLEGIELQHFVSDMQKELLEVSKLVRKMKDTCSCHEEQTPRINTLVTVEYVPDDEVNKKGIEEEIMLDF